MLTKAKKWFPWLLLACCLMALCLFMGRAFPKMLDCDMASTLVGSWHMAKEGTVISPNWYYSTELLVLSNQLIFVPLFMIFEDWHVVRMLGTIIQYALLLLSYYFFCSQAKIKRSFALSASFLFLPFSSVHFMFVLTATHYYLPHVAMMFLMAGLYLRCGFVETKKKALLSAILLAILSFGVGLGGLRLILLFHLPALVLAMFVYCAANCQWKRFNLLSKGQAWKLLLSSVFAAGCALVGDLINARVLPQFFHFSNYHTLSFRPFDLDKLVTLVNDIFLDLGYQPSTSVFSTSLFGALLCLCLVLLCASAIVFSLRPVQTSSNASRASLITLFLGVALLIFAAVITLTDVDYWAGHLCPLIPFVPPVIAAWFLEQRQWNRSWSTAIAVGISCVLVAASACVYRDFASVDKTYEERVIADVMVEEGYTTGYATFWQGNSITEFSNGQIDMRVWSNNEEYNEMMDVDSVTPWLQAKSHETTKPEGKVFLLFSMWWDQHEDFSLARWLNPEDVLFDTDNFRIYAYDSYDEMIHSVNQHVTADFADGRWYAQNYRRTGDTTLQPGASTHGLDVPLYPGRYTMTITGNGLENVQSQMVHKDGTVNATLLSATDHQLIFQLETDTLLHNLDVLLQNTSQEAVKVETLVIEKQKIAQ